MKSISVVIPSFNRSCSTHKAVLSALAQTVRVSEILVIDDASDPPLNTLAFNNLDPRVKVYRLAANTGAAGARQAGIDLATGDIVAFLDSDDSWLPQKLATQLPLLKDDVLCAVTCGWNEVDAGNRLMRTRVPIEADRPALFVGGCWFCPGSTVIIARSTLKQIGQLDTRLRRLEDFDWFLRFALAGGQLVVSPIVGAEIAVGARAKVAPVQAAVDTILEKSACFGLSKLDLRTLRAWLDIESARAAINDGYYIRAAAHLARSWILRPRMRIQLKRWWKTENHFTRFDGRKPMSKE